MLNIAQMRLADTKPLGQLVLIKLTNTALTALDILADTQQAFSSYIFHLHFLCLLHTLGQNI